MSQQLLLPLTVWTEDDDADWAGVYEHAIHCWDERLLSLFRSWQETLEELPQRAVGFENLERLSFKSFNDSRLRVIALEGDNVDHDEEDKDTEYDHVHLRTAWPEAAEAVGWGGYALVDDEVTKQFSAKVWHPDFEARWVLRPGTGKLRWRDAAVRLQVQIGRDISDDNSYQASPWLQLSELIKLDAPRAIVRTGDEPPSTAQRRLARRKKHG